MRFRLENTNTGDVVHAVAANRKDAHEIGAALWPFAAVEVTTVQEYADTYLWRRYKNTIESFMDDAYMNIPDSNDATIVACLNRALGELVELRDYFAARLPEDSNGTIGQDADDPKPTIH